MGMYDESEYGGDAVNFNHDWNYPLQWIWETEVARAEYRQWCFRMNLAMLGKPSRNLYEEETRSNLKRIDDPKAREAALKACVKVPEGRSFALKKAVENRANQMAGGVDTYDYQVDDPYNIIDDDTEELLATKCEQDYIQNHLESLAAPFSRDLSRYGMAGALVKYCPDTDRNLVYRINPKNIGWDTKYSAFGVERFRYYNTMISWKKLKEIIQRDGDKVNTTIKAPDRSFLTEADNDGKRTIKQGVKYNNKKIRTLNGLDIYVDTLNSLACSSQVQWGALAGYAEFEHDLRTCYNLGWYQSFATDPRKKTNNGYDGDDVELTVLYDLVNHIEFKIINRRYVVSMNTEAFHRKVAFPIKDTRTVPATIKKKYDDYYLECPLVVRFEEQFTLDSAPYPTCVGFSLLDIFDELCAWRAKRDHVSKILSILRIETNGADARSLKGVLNVMGVVLDDIQGDINTIKFEYDYTAIDSEIEYRENLIANMMHAYDQFDALQAMGDRASAAESGMALSAIAQGLTTHQNAIMGMYADIARVCIANRVVYSSKSVFPVTRKGDYSAITAQQMALTATITVKPKLAKKIEQKTLSTSALTLLGTLKGVLPPEGVSYLVNIALMGTVPRGLASSFTREQEPSQQEMALAQQEAQNQAAALAQNQQMYQENPGAYEIGNIMQNVDPDTIDQIITAAASEGDTTQPNSADLTEMSDVETMVQPLDMNQQDGALSTNLPGLTTESGSAYANPSGSMGVI